MHAACRRRDVRLSGLMLRGARALASYRPSMIARAVRCSSSSACGRVRRWHAEAVRFSCSADRKSGPRRRRHPFKCADRPARGAATSGLRPCTAARQHRPSVAFCVRLCDGKGFPMAHLANATPVETCQAMCPASKTKVFFGLEIDGAVARDGTRYGQLENAFLFRKHLVANCTCNGRDAFGLAPLNIAERCDIAAGRYRRDPEGADGLYRQGRAGRRVHTGRSVEHHEPAEFGDLAAGAAHRTSPAMRPALWLSRRTRRRAICRRSRICAVRTTDSRRLLRPKTATRSAPAIRCRTD